MDDIINDRLDEYDKWVSLLGYVPSEITKQNNQDQYPEESE